MPDSIPCPDPTCTASAQIIDRWTWESTVGPVEHVKTMCGRGHGFTPPSTRSPPNPLPRRW